MNSLSPAVEYADSILRPYTNQGQSLLGVSDVMDILSRKDRNQTICIMREQMGAMKDGHEWKVRLTSVRQYILLRYNPSIAEIAQRLARPSVRRSSHKVQPKRHQP
jgi:hypothetical protein